jgi:hypothetical protein
MFSPYRQCLRNVPRRRQAVGEHESVILETGMIGLAMHHVLVVRKSLSLPMKTKASFGATGSSAGTRAIANGRRIVDIHAEPTELNGVQQVHQHR